MWVVTERWAGSACSLPHKVWGVSKGAGFRRNRSWTFTQQLVDLQRCLLKGVLGAKSLRGFNARLVKYLKENKLCEAQKKSLEMNMVEGGKAAQKKAHVGVPLLLFPWHPLMAVAGEQAAHGRGVLARKKGSWYILILCWSFSRRFWFTSLISTKPPPNWVDWPWLLQSRQLIKDWLISSQWLAPCRKSGNHLRATSTNQFYALRFITR